jgi:hypothetical protein
LMLAHAASSCAPKCANFSSIFNLDLDHYVIKGNYMKTNLSQVVAAAALSVLLAACGGGGGGGSTTSIPGGATTTTGGSTSSGSTTTAADLIATGTASYAAGTVERGAYDELMRVRTTCGFGALNQNTKIDAAEAAHAYYLAKNSADSVNSFYIGHFEDPSLSYFTGNAPVDRLTHQGYSWGGTNEILNSSNSTHSSSLAAPWTPSAALGAEQMRGLIHTVYHAQGAFFEGREVGMGFDSQIWNAGVGFNRQAIRFGALVAWATGTTSQKLGTGNVASYPCAGITNVRPNFAPATESPNPIPAITDATTMVGTPLYFKVDSGQVLAVSVFTLTRLSTGTPVVSTAMSASNDPHSKVKASEVFYLPSAALAPNEMYRVQASGTVDGVSWTKDFTFTTGVAE